MVKEAIVAIFNKNKKRYGYRRITQELHNNDICVNHKTVRKLMKQLGLVCHVRERRKYNSYKGEVGEVAPNLLERHFKTNEPNRKWVTDVTEFKGVTRSFIYHQSLICSTEKWSVIILAAILILSKSRICWKVLFGSCQIK